LSTSATSEIALLIMLFSPSIAHVTFVPSGLGVNVNVASFLHANGLTNSSLIAICEAFALSELWALCTIVMRPSPALSLPAQA
jgi:hypothetical protein